MTLTYGSLFSGAGGFDIGFDTAEWSGRWQVESDKICQRILQRHWPDIPKYLDVADMDGASIEPVDAILFGFPCQDVSQAQYYHRRNGLSGKRSSLFFEAARIIQEMRDATENAYPRYAIAENVVGLLSSESGRSFLRVLQTLVELGAMAIEWRVLDAQDFGLPQRRKRVFLIANFNSGGESGPPIFPAPASLSRHNPSNKKSPRPVPPSNDGCVDEYRVFNRIGDYRYIEDVVASPILASKFGRQSTFVLQNGGTNLRRLTPLESERMQGWPDFHTAYDAHGKLISDTQRYKMIGNGVAVPCATWVAQRIAAYDSTLQM